MATKDGTEVKLTGKPDAGSIAGIVFASVLIVVAMVVIGMSVMGGSGSCGSVCGGGYGGGGGGSCMYGSSFRNVQAGKDLRGSQSAYLSSTDGWLGQGQVVLDTPRMGAIDGPIDASCPRVPEWAKSCEGACARSMASAREAVDRVSAVPAASSAVCTKGYTAITQNVMVAPNAEFPQQLRLEAQVPISGSVIREMRTRFRGQGDIVTLTADMVIPGRGILPLYRGRAITANLQIPAVAISPGTYLDIVATARDMTVEKADFQLTYDACL